MRIVIDLQGAQTESRFRGIGRYTMSFAQAIVRNRGVHEVFLALNGLFPDSIEPIRRAFFDLLPPENIRVWYAPGPLAQIHASNAQHHTVAELVREAFLASLRPDLIHISSLFEGFADDAVTSIGRFDQNTPVSVALYDLIPLLNAEHYLTHNPPYERYYRSKVDYIKRPTNLLLAISEFARREGLEHLGLPESQLVNVSTAIDANFTQIDIGAHAARQIRSKCGITRHFVLYTGGDDERKNLPRLIQAYAALPPTLRHSHQLLFAGKMGANSLANFQHLARSAGLQDDELLFTGYVNDAELIQLYNLCALYVFPSWHEGFGLPALEAMACGAPVIGANASSLPEVIGLDEALFNPLDVASISAKMQHALSDTAFRQRLRAHGLQQAKHFSWDQTAQHAIAAWEALHDKQHQPACYASPTTIKPRLAFVSPLPPERTGIADYSAELLPALAQHYDIYVVVDQELTTDAWAQQSACIRDINWLREHAQHMDYVLYQFGNSPFHKHMLPLLKTIPGTVVLHDFYLSGLEAWLEICGEDNNAWARALYQAHGYGAVQMRISDAETAKLHYPANFEVLQYAQGIIVHSKYSQKLANQWYAGIAADDWEVIPLLRHPPEVGHKMDCKKALGFIAEDFVLCSFGFLDSTKLNQRLLTSWLASALAKNQRCHLIFVGENHGGEYGAKLLEAIQNSEAAQRIHITGFASPELFRQYLGAADVAVQLRTQSRGETSAAILDCMNYAVPTIVNANGSIAELDANTVWMLPDEFDDAELINALETLWRSPAKRQALGEKARTAIRERHDPMRCAAMYANAIERFHVRAQTTTHVLLQRLLNTGQLAAYSDAQLLELADAIATTLPLPRPAKNLLLDITATCNNDLKTGIERVARAIILALIASPPLGYRIEPVYLSQENGLWHYRYARSYTLELLGCQNDLEDDDIVAPQAGDILLGLDLSGDTLVQAQQQGLHSMYRDRGVVVYFMVHDLLPVNQPDVFPPGADLGHATWLNAISSFDGAICVSKAVAGDLSKWQQEKNPRDERQRPFVIGWSHHGADLANSAPSQGLPRSAQGILRKIASRPSFLMVGTIEPRKSYAQTVAAFTQLWQAGVDVNLVIVGAEGWKDLPAEARRDIPETVEQLRQHPESDKRLFWLAGISDEYLEKIYAASSCLIAASYGEGFGLPLIEAAQHQLPIMARDIPVFREVAGEHAHYFQAESAADLAQALQQWLALYQEGRHPQSTGMPWLTWRESAQNLWREICGTA